MIATFAAGYVAGGSGAVVEPAGVHRMQTSQVVPPTAEEPPSPSATATRERARPRDWNRPTPVEPGATEPSLANTAAPGAISPVGPGKPAEQGASQTATRQVLAQPVPSTFVQMLPIEGSWTDGNDTLRYFLSDDGGSLVEVSHIGTADETLTYHADGTVSGDGVYLKLRSQAAPAPDEASYVFRLAAGSSSSIFFLSLALNGPDTLLRQTEGPRLHSRLTLHRANPQVAP